MPVFKLFHWLYSNSNLLSILDLVAQRMTILDFVSSYPIVFFTVWISWFLDLPSLFAYFYLTLFSGPVLEICKKKNTLALTSKKTNGW